MHSQCRQEHHLFAIAQADVFDTASSTTTVKPHVSDKGQSGLGAYECLQFHDSPVPSHLVDWYGMKNLTSCTVSFDMVCLEDCPPPSII